MTNSSDHLTQLILNFLNERGHNMVEQIIDMVTECLEEDNSSIESISRELSNWMRARSSLFGKIEIDYDPYDIMIDYALRNTDWEVVVEHIAFNLKNKE